MKFIITFFSMLFIGLTMNLSAQNAPIATLGTLATASTTVNVPITATNFTNIGSCNMKILYDPAIATATDVIPGPDMDPSIDVNLSVPGEIRFGWYPSASTTLTNGSVMFYITFNKVGFGTSILSFDDDQSGTGCIYFDGSLLNALNDSPTSTYYKSGSLKFIDNVSPVTTAPAITASVGATIGVPVTVTGFNNIGAVSLRLQYDPSVLTFKPATNTGGFPGLKITNPQSGTILIGGSNNNAIGYSLINGSVFFTLNFTYLGGTTALSWIDNGESCEYADPLSNNVLNDTPQSTYYINGSVGSSQATPSIVVGTIINPVTCGGNGSIPLTFTNVPDGNYIINYTGGSFTSVAVSGNAATIAAPAGTYTNLQITVNGVSSATGVNATVSGPVVPAAPTASATLQPTCGVATGTITVTAPNGTGMTYSINGTTYTNLNGIFTLVPAGIYAVTAKSAAGCISQATSVTINAQPITPATPTVSATLQPTCAVATGTITVTAPTGSGMTYSINGTTYTNSNGIFTLVPAGTYSVTAKSAAGCISSGTNVTINAQPTVPIIQSASVTPTSVIVSGQVLFSATASSGIIKWYDASTGGTEITNLNPTISATTTYYAEAISDAGCVSTTRTPVTATVIPQGTTQLSYRFTNPEIANLSGTDYFLFDVEVKANENSYFWKGNVNLDFNKNTLSSDPNDWSIIPALLLYYSTPISINGSNLNIDCNPGIDANSDASPSDFALITTAYQTMFTVSVKITDQTGVAGIVFNEGNMNGKQFYYLSQSPWYGVYMNPNNYDPANFIDTYVGRVYATKFGWTQVGGLNWDNSVNTSVWEGSAAVPGGSTANAGNLRIHIPAIITLPIDGQMTVTGNTEIKTVNGLILLSDGNGTGSFITGTASGAGNAIAKRYMTTGAWHIVASPVSGQSIASFLGTNANVATDAVNSTVRAMMDYNPTANVWNDYFTNSTTGTLETGKGFCIRTNKNSAVTFNGNLHAGVQTVSVTPDSWNCIGNPYTSAIGINNSSSSTVADFIDANTGNLDPIYSAVYVWYNLDANDGLAGKYTVISNASPGFDVQQGQAFLVKTNTTAASVGFNSRMQIHQPDLDLKSAKNVWPTINLEVSANSQKSSTVIAFNSGMTKGLDPTYDAGLLKGGSDLLIYSRLVEDNGIPFAIQALPSNDYSSMIIPIGLDFKTGGDVVFSATSLNLPSDCMIILEDKLNQSFTDLSKDVYNASVAANSSLSDRFKLHTSYLSTGLDMNYFTGKLSAYAVRNVEIRLSGQVSNQAIATLYDIQGREILVKKLNEGNLNVIRTPNIKSAMYLLFIKDNGKSQGFKIPVRE